MVTMEVVKQLSANVFGAWNRHDAEALAALYGDDGVREAPNLPEPVRGRDALRDVFAQAFRVFPNLTVELLTQVAEGNRSAVEWRLRGTNAGPLELLQLPATGKAVDITGLTLIEVSSEGKITSERVYYDLRSFLEQLGLAS